MMAWELEAAETVCRIYFDIAAEVIGEKEVRRRFNRRLNEEIKARKNQHKTNGKRRTNTTTQR